MIAERGGGVEGAADEEDPARPGAPPRGDEDDEAELDELGEGDAEGGAEVFEKQALDRMGFDVGAELADVLVGRDGVEDGADDQECKGITVALQERARVLLEGGEFGVAGNEIQPKT